MCIMYTMTSEIISDTIAAITNFYFKGNQKIISMYDMNELQLITGYRNDIHVCHVTMCCGNALPHPPKTIQYGLF
jgi:hypothetical protein